MVALKKTLVVLLGGVGFFSLFLWVYMINQYSQTLPKEPQPSMGRTISLNNHGTVVYLTKEEDSRLTWIFGGGMACGIFAGALSLRN